MRERGRKGKTDKEGRGRGGRVRGTNEKEEGGKDGGREEGGRKVEERDAICLRERDIK